MAQPKLILSDISSPPVRLGRYELGRELGRGFSSIVYEATDTLKGRRVALKVLTFLQNLTPARRQEMSERFEREARAISALSHPAIVSIYEVGHADDGRQFLVMEHLEGETLRARLERAGPMLRAEALPQMVQIADALQYAHGRGIIHRDVKPDNVFLCPDGTAKLMDFGVAHVFADDGLTQTGMVVGSPAYMSPEQINGQMLDGRTDVFSLAVTTVEALTGRKPFDAPNIPAVMNRILHQPPQLAGIASRSLRRALERALAKNPQVRTPSAGAFAEALRRTMPFPGALETITGTQVMPAPSARPIFSSPRRVFPWENVGLGAAALALAALLSLPFWGHRPAAPSPARVVVVSEAPKPAAHLYEIPTHWHRAIPARAVRSSPNFPRPMTIPHVATATLGSGDAEITEHPVTVGTPPLTLGLLNALRNQTSNPFTVPTRRARPAPVTVRVSAMRQQQWTPAAPPSTTPSPPAYTPSPPAAVDTPPPPVMTAPSGNSGPDWVGSDTMQAPQATGVPDSAPRLVEHAPLQTPPGIAPQELPATVGLLVSVNEDGDVSDARVTQSSGDPALDAAAIAAVLRWEYDPAFHAGRACPATVAAQVKFSQ